MEQAYIDILHDLKRAAEWMREVEIWKEKQIRLLDKIHQDVERLRREHKGGAYVRDDVQE